MNRLRAGILALVDPIECALMACVLHATDDEQRNYWKGVQASFRRLYKLVLP